MSFYDFFNINNIFFQIASYQISYLEFAGTILSLWSAWLVAKSKILNWPIGILAVVLFGVLYYQIRLYSDMIEQVYYFVTGFYGWWLWSKLAANNRKDKKVLAVSTYSLRQNLFIVSLIMFFSVTLGLFMSRIHLIFPQFFPLPADFPYLDALTTVVCFAAQIMMAHKKIECWYLWIIYNTIGIGLYFVKGVVFISGLYVAYLVLAFISFKNWKKLPTAENQNKTL